MKGHNFIHNTSNTPNVHFMVVVPENKCLLVGAPKGGSSK